jgi:predicted secreted protein
MSSFINGFGGSINFNSQDLVVESWSLTVNGEAVDTTNTGDSGWESNILGAKSWEGSCKTYWDSSAIPTGAAGFLPGARATISLSVGSSGKIYTGFCQITQITVENPVKGVVGFNFNFKGSGALTFAS